jgi:hypothetical protein
MDSAAQSNLGGQACTSASCSLTPACPLASLSPVPFNGVNDIGDKFIADINDTAKHLKSVTKINRWCH